MIKRIFSAALIAGAVAGALASAVQSVRLVPMVLLAETFEAGQAASHGHGDGHASAKGGGEEPSPLGRTGLTVAADVVIGVGFALILAAGMVLRGGAVTWRAGVSWGLAGFAAFSLAPAAGLPPEPPGTFTADLADRQLWWLLTAAATAAGLVLLAYGGRVPYKALGVALIALPHVIGAPEPAQMGGAVPVELALSFAANALAINAVFWVVLGGLTAYLLDRFGRRAE